MKRTEWNEFIKNSGQVNFLRWVVETYGYSLEAAYVDWKWEPRVYLTKADYEDRYLPRLYLEVDYDWNEMKVKSYEWTIETVSYWSKTTEEYAKLMEKMKNWLDCCRFLNQFNYDMLPKIPKEFDEE
jgi:hypothetical protein